MIKKAKPLFERFRFLKNMIKMKSSIEERAQGVCHDGGDGNTDETWHHERVVEQVLTNDGGA